MNTMYIGGTRHRLSERYAALARSGLPGAARIRNSAVRIWRTVARLLGALDKRMTENLDRRARLMLYGEGRRPADRQRRK
jgi:hypothetical protein